MRTTLTLDKDVAAALERLRKARKASLKAVVNEARWEEGFGPDGRTPTGAARAAYAPGVSRALPCEQYRQYLGDTRHSRGRGPFR